MIWYHDQAFWLDFELEFLPAAKKVLVRWRQELIQELEAQNHKEAEEVFFEKIDIFAFCDYDELERFDFLWD